MAKKKKNPTIKSKVFKLRHEPNWCVEADYALTGSPVVTVHIGDAFTEDLTFTPLEAEGIAKAFIAAAKCARAKGTLRIR